jgi:vanillate O-demethylase ferredoxin subunit
MATTDLLRVRVARKVQEAEGICSLDLVAEDGTALPAFTAGAHVEVQLPFVRAGLARPYSLCNSPAETHRYQIAVLKEPASRGGSRALHDQVHEGMLLDIRPPRNQFALAPQARQHLLLAGGIGITPLLSMAEALCAAGADFALHCAARSAGRLAFAQRLAAAPYAQRVHVHLDSGPAHQRLDLDALLAAPVPGCHLYVCGPAGFMDAALGTAARAGWAPDQVHLERFGAEPVAPVDGGGFEVQLASTGRVITVRADQSVLQALSEAGLELPSSCEQGICGTCLTRVVSGVPDHRDQYLLPQEQAANDQFLPCCSRARSPRLVLDL